VGNRQKLSKEEARMFKPLAMMLVGTAGLAWLAVGAAAEDKGDKADAQSKEVVEQFMKALKAETTEAALKVADVPFFWDGKEVIKEREELKKAFAQVFAEKDLTQIEYTIKEVSTLEKMREKLSEKERELLKDVLEKDDRVVFVELKSDAFLAVMVRIREGKAKVAGFRD
jgi:hypothetical protein